ncbi:hypothetical protein [Glutamicibacter sp. TV12E]|uniref:hypothetical protein n=1 Tax=Glutamicibacter sp. TV12E TaxID=3446362 RepID=UPI004033516B
MRKLCPACLARLEHVVHPDCVVCAGTGYLALNEGAVALYRTEVVSKTVELCLEAAARISDMTRTLSDDRTQRVSSVIEKLQAVGLLVAEESPYINTAWWAEKKKSKQPRGEDGKFAPFLDAGELTEQVIQEPLVPLDMVLSAAAPYQYERTERPGARGLPVLSDNGYPSHLARVADPMEPGRSTMDWIQARNADQREASVLVEAVDLAAAKKRRRLAKQAAIQN